MNKIALFAAPVAAFLLLVPLATACMATSVTAPAVAEQIRQDPCATTLPGSHTLNISVSTSTPALPPVGTPRRASLRNPPASIPDSIKALYVKAAARYRVPWALLAGVGMEETAHGRNNSTSSAGAQGLMQFMPRTWKIYGTDGDGDRRASITNDADSVMSAARYLAATGARTTAGVRKALYTYNHATWYVNDVLSYAHHYNTGGNGTTATGAVVCDQGADGGDDGPVPDGPGGSCPPSGSAAERGLKRNALRGLRCVKATFGWIRSMGGVGPRPNKSDHPAGRAVDFMIPHWNTRAGNANGWKVAHWLQKNAATLNVKYIIFDDHVWRSYRASQGWTRYTHPNGATSNPTLRHLDHVHGSFA